MSRIGRKSITLPTGVTVSVMGLKLVVKGPKGELSIELHPQVAVAVEGPTVTVTRSSEAKSVKAFHGLVRSLINNAVVGVSTGFRKTLKLVGTGYRAAAKGKSITLALGYSHTIDVVPMTGVNLAVEGTDTIHVDGIDKQKVGQMAANIRGFRPPEPYQGKGVRYSDEVVKRKQGKAAA